VAAPRFPFVRWQAEWGACSAKFCRNHPRRLQRLDHAGDAVSSGTPRSISTATATMLPSRLTASWASTAPRKDVWPRGPCLVEAYAGPSSGGGRDHRNPRPASIGTGGRLHSESPADFVGMRMRVIANSSESIPGQCSISRPFRRRKRSRYGAIKRPPGRPGPFFG
jgi:hypothetical protein